MDFLTTLLIVIGIIIGIWLVVVIVRRLRGDSVVIDGRTYGIDSKGDFNGTIK